MATSPLLAKVVRGAHLPAGRHNGAVTAAGLFEDAGDHSERPVDEVVVSGEYAVSNRNDIPIPKSGVPAPDARIADRAADRAEEGGPLSRVHSAQSVAETTKVEVKPGDDQLQAFVRAAETRPLLAKGEGDDVAPASRFAGEKEPGIGAPEPARIESETAGGEIPVRVSRPDEDRRAGPAENRLRSLQAGDFRSGHEKRRERGDALKALFPAQSTEPGRDGLFSIAGEGGKDTGMSRREGEQDEYGGHVNAGALPPRNSRGASPEGITDPREDRPRSEDHGETVIPTGPARRNKPAQGTMETPLDHPFPKGDVLESSDGKAGVGGAIPIRPVLKSDVFAPPRQALPQEMPLRREGRVKIGNINILVKGRDRAGKEEIWPEAPAYADHMITEDWEWSCRYGR